MKTAKLVSISMTTRIIVEDDTTEEQIINAAKDRFIDKINNEIGEHIEEIIDDSVVPYDSHYD